MREPVKNIDSFDDLLSDVLLEMAQKGLVIIEGDQIILTEKGREYMSKIEDMK